MSGWRNSISNCLHSSCKPVRWADCDPVGLVYTGKFNEYMLLAVHYFFLTNSAVAITFSG